MSGRVRVVSPDDGHPKLPFADTARALLERVLNSGATGLLLIWELPDDSCQWQAVPMIASLERGLVDRLHETLHPAGEGDDEQR
jgi:hypothetical protein